jgi:hypothetical protein
MTAATLTQTAPARPLRAPTPAQAAAQELGSADGRWLMLTQVQALLSLTDLPGTRPQRRLLAGALRNGRVRLTPKAAKLVMHKLGLAGERAPEVLAEWLSPR